MSALRPHSGHWIGRDFHLKADVRQHGSVDAGRVFGQLHDIGMKTHVLDKIVRQASDLLRKAVEAIIAGDSARRLTRSTGVGAVLPRCR